MADDIKAEFQQAARIMFEGEVTVVSQQLSEAATNDDVLSIPLAAFARIDPNADRLSQKAGVACKAGCSWCCRGLKVDISVPEAVMIADTLRHTYAGNELQEFRRAFDEVAAEVRGMTGRERWISQAPCVFLDSGTGECSIYDVRPLPCRAHSSLDAGSCERAAGDPTERLTMQKFLVTAQLYGLAGDAQGEVYERANLDARRFELTNAVALALGEPDAGTKWLGGSRLFDDAVIPSDAVDRVAAGLAVQRAAGLVPPAMLVRHGKDRNAKKRQRRAQRGKGD